MKRRHFLAVAGASATAIMLNDISRNSGLRVGVVSSLFNFSGYSKVTLSSLTEYDRHIDAYHDLQIGKIDALVSSANFLGGVKPEFSLFGSLLSVDNKDKWIDENYHIISRYHADQGLLSSYLGSMSPLMVRVSNLPPEQLAQWGEQRIAGTGVRKVWFNQLGFDVPHEQNSQRLTAQLAQVCTHFLNVTDAFPPTLFLRSLQQNSELGVITHFTSDTNVIIDTVSKSSVPVELHFKKENELATQPLQKYIRDAVKNDSKYQQAALELFVEQTGLPLVSSLPQPVCSELSKCKEAYLNFLIEQNPAANALVDSFRKFRGT
jgi:hypothetical protein